MIINLKSILIATSIAILTACGGSAGNGSVTCTTTDKQTTCVDTSHVSVPGPTLVGDATVNSPAKAPEKPATANLVPVPNPPIPHGQQTPVSADSGLHPATPQTACFNTVDATGCPTNPGEGLRVSPGSQVPSPCGPAPTPVFLPDGQVDLTSVVGYHKPTC